MPNASLLHLSSALLPLQELTAEEGGYTPVRLKGGTLVVELADRQLPFVLIPGAVQPAHPPLRLLVSQLEM